MPSDRPSPGDEMEVLEDGSSLVLSDLLNHVFDQGVVISGSVTIGIAGIDLVRLDLDLLLASVETTAQRLRGRARASEPNDADLPLLPADGSE